MYSRGMILMVLVWPILCVERTEDQVIISESKEKYTFNIGAKVTLNCNQPPGSPPPTRVIWSRDRGDLPPTAFKNRDNTLEMTNVQPSDSGRYTCEAYGPQGVTRQVVTIVIESKANQVDNSNDVAINEASQVDVFKIPSQTYDVGTEVTLFCNQPFNTRPPTPVRWSLDGRGLPSKAYPNRENDLIIPNAQVSDSGRYTCEAYGPQGLKRTSIDINIRVNANQVDTNVRPSQVTENQSRFTFESGTNVFLSCNLPNSQPPTQVRWTREGTAMPFNAYQDSENQLQIPNAQPNDSGRYVCELVGPQGVESSRTRIDIRRRGGRPQESVGRRPAVLRRRPQVRSMRPNN